jgi:hypothetical protein
LQGAYSEYAGETPNWAARDAAFNPSIHRKRKGDADDSAQPSKRGRTAYKPNDYSILQQANKVSANAKDKASPSWKPMELKSSHHLALKQYCFNSAHGPNGMTVHLLKAPIDSIVHDRAQRVWEWDLQFDSYEGKMHSGDPEIEQGRDVAGYPVQ